MFQKLLLSIIAFVQSIFSPSHLSVPLPSQALIKPTITENIIQYPLQTPTPSPSPPPISLTPAPSLSFLMTPTPFPASNVSYNIGYASLVAQYNLRDEIPKPPVIPPEGYITGTNPDFIRTVKSDYLYTLHKAELENLVFNCQVDPKDWRTAGAHNVYTWKKYGIDNFHGDTTNYVNLIIQNPSGGYDSQRSDFQKIQSIYCKDHRELPI